MNRSVGLVEYLDILDENGNKTGEKKPRRDVHSKGYWHKGIHIWIINSKKELLVQRRSANKDVYPNKLYISVAGHPVSGEDEIEGIIYINPYIIPEPEEIEKNKNKYGPEKDQASYASINWFGFNSEILHSFRGDSEKNSHKGFREIFS